MLNIKQTFYRTSTLFIKILRKIYGTKSSSRFDVINELADQNMISDCTKHKLLYVVAISYEVRLSVYMNEKSQRDYIQPHENDTTVFEQILKIIDKDAIISYFQITYCLQREIIKLLGIKEIHIYSNASLLNLTICYALKLDDLMLSLLKLENYKVRDFLCSSIFGDMPSNSNENIDEVNNIAVKACINFDKCLSYLEKEITAASKLTLQSEVLELYYNLLDVSNYLLEKDNIDEALEFLSRILEILQRLSVCDVDCKRIQEHEKKDVNDLMTIIIVLSAFCLIDLNRFDEASSYINQAFSVVDTKNYESKSKADFYFLMGNLRFKMKHYSQSLNCLRVSLKIILIEELDICRKFSNYDIMTIHSGIGTCLMMLDQNEQAVIHLKIAAKMIGEYELEEPDYTIKLAFSASSTFHNLGECFFNLKQFEDGFLCLYQALEIAGKDILTEENGKVVTQLKNETYSDKIKTKNLIGILRALGLHFMKENRFQKAVSYLHLSFNLFKTHFAGESNNAARVELLTCYLEIHQREQVEKYLKGVLTSGKFNSFIFKVHSQFLTYAYQL